MNKFVLGMLALSLGTSAVAAEDWVSISYKNNDIGLYFDENSLQTKVDKYKNRYIQANFQRSYTDPKKTSDGKYYTNFYHTMSVDCANEAYAMFDKLWAVNGQSVTTAVGKKDEWNLIEQGTVIEAEVKGLCKYYKSFLG